MTTIKVKGKKIKVRTDIDELTFAELTAFQQYFAKILYDINIPLFDEVKQKVFEALNDGQIAKAIILLENFSQGLKTQEVGADAWLYCFSILLAKEKPIIDESGLLEFYNKFSGYFSEKLIKDIVVNFTKAFPQLYHLYKMRAEGLTQLMNFV